MKIQIKFGLFLIIFVLISSVVVNYYYTGNKIDNRNMRTINIPPPPIPDNASIDQTRYFAITEYRLLHSTSEKIDIRKKIDVSEFGGLSISTNNIVLGSKKSAVKEWREHQFFLTDIKETELFLDHVNNYSEFLSPSKSQKITDPYNYISIQYRFKGSENNDVSFNYPLLDKNISELVKYTESFAQKVGRQYIIEDFSREVFVSESDLKEPIRLEFSELMEKPQLYEGKRISTYGYFINHFEVRFLRQSENEIQDDPLSKDVWIGLESAFADPKNIESINSKMVRIEGIFHRTPRDIYPYKIERITLISAK